MVAVDSASSDNKILRTYTDEDRLSDCRTTSKKFMASGALRLRGFKVLGLRVAVSGQELPFPGAPDNIGVGALDHIIATRPL